MARRGRPPTNDILTPREWEVLHLIREGLTNREIAERLGISLSGAKHHVSEIISKLGVERREEAAVWRPEDQRKLRAGLVAMLSRASILAKAAAVVGLAAVGALIIAGVALAPDRFGGGRTGKVPADTAGEYEQAASVAHDVVPDALLVQVSIDMSAGSTVFNFLGADGRTQVDVTIPEPAAPPAEWSVESGPLSVEASLLGRRLDFSGLAVDEPSAAYAVAEKLGCQPTSLTLAPLGDRQGERQTWVVDCGFADGRRVLGFVEAATGRLEVPSAPVEPAAVRALAGGPRPPGPTKLPLDTAPEWSKADYVTRDGALLTVRLLPSGEEVRIDLSQVGVFDCRIECYVDIGSRLGGLTHDDEICVGWLAVRDGHQDGMLWVDRYSCEEGGRVIPP